MIIEEINNMSKQEIFLLGISLSLMIILFSIPSASAISEKLEFEIPSPNDNSLDFPFAITTDSEDKIFVSSTFFKNIYIYNNGNLLSTINNSTIYPSSVSIDTNNRIIISDVFSNAVHVLDSNGTYLFKLGFNFDTPIDVTTDSNNRIIVADKGAYLTHIFYANGTHQFTIAPPHTGDIPTGVATDSNDRIIITDDGNDEIHIYDSAGNYVFKIDEAIPGTTSFISPFRVTTDTKDRIIVMDSTATSASGKHAVFIYNSEGTFLHTISYASFNHIQLGDVATDSNDRILVADKPGKVVRVYSMNYGDGDGANSKNKGGGCGDCTPPTFGKNTKGQMIVQGGFSFNGNSTDVIEYHTPYHMITASTNSTHNFTLKAFENNGINSVKWFQFGIVPEVGSDLNDAEVLATIYISSTQVEKVEDPDENNLWDIINATSYIEECGYVTSDCLEVSLDVMFREELKNKVIVIQAMDVSRNADTKFLNDGIETIGESINEPLVSYVSASKGGAFYPQDRGVVELTLTSYKNNLWQDSFGYEWSTDNYGFYIISTVPVPLKEPDVMWQAMTRMNSNFADMIQFEKDRAVLVFDSSKLASVVGDSFAYDYFETIENKLDNPLILEKMKLAEQYAIQFTKDYTKNQHLYQKNSYNHWNYFGAMSVSEITQMDYQTKLRVQNEMLEQRLADKVQYSK